jgi:hypothetical protein
VEGKRYFLHDHQNKSIEYARALANAGYLRTQNHDDADFLFTDIDVLGRRRMIKIFNESGRPAFMYPHTGRPVLQYDGWYPPHPGITAMFTPAIGGVEVLHKYGFHKMLQRPRPIHPVGWSMCPIRKFKVNKNPKKVLFAPIHVNGNGYLSDREKRTNALVFNRLIAIKDKIKLTVRFLYKLEWNGIWPEKGVTFVQGAPDQSIKEILEADCVISHQNMAYLAIASGVPTLMMAEHKEPISGSSLNNTMEVRSWPKYRDYLKFPWDILANKDTHGLIRAACQSEDRIWLWKQRMIGNPFDPKLFIKILEEYLDGS